MPSLNGLPGTEAYSFAAIVKVQWPISTNGPKPMCLIYDRSRALIHRMEAADKKMKALMGGALKIYVHAGITSDGRIVFGDRVKDQPW